MVADYYERAALAAAHALAGDFDGTRFRQLLEMTPVGLALDGRESSSFEGRAIADLTVRLLARLYSTLSISSSAGGDDEVRRLNELAKQINPKIETGSEPPAVGIAIGSAPSPFAETIYVGSNGWDAYVSTTGAQPLGDTIIPFGAGAAACLACANLFRLVFTDDWPANADRELVFSTFDLTRMPTAETPKLPKQTDEPAVLVGVGAIGNAAAWPLSRTSLNGVLHLVDDQAIELSNLQRYVLASRRDDEAVKVELAARFFATKKGPSAEPHRMSWAEFASEFGYAWPRVLLALDSASDRCAVQASLPHWIANSWTQPGDLGVSVHPDFTDGACVCCLYLQDAKTPNEDELVAAALGVPELVAQVRQFLHTGEGLQPPFLDLVAQRLGQPPKALAAFAGRPVRDLYVVGICGGAVLPLGPVDVPDPRLHVPLAHQSALAGILLAATYIRGLSSTPFDTTRVLRADLLRPLAEIEPLPLQKRGDGRCICEDDDYRAAYQGKWHTRRRKPRSVAVKPSPGKAHPGTRTNRG